MTSACAYNVYSQNCPARLFFEKIADKWVLLILNVLEEQPIHEEGIEKLRSGLQGEAWDNIFSINLEYIDYKKTVQKLKGDKDLDE